MKDKDKHCGMDCVDTYYADTYIEERFVYLCNINRADEVLDCWKEDKRYYTSFTGISVFDFQHYSLHDKSHSVSILRNIEKILGRARVDSLEAGDLWLLLESAYSHDVGMSVDYEKLVRIWESKDFEKYVNECLIAESADKARASQFYDKLNDLVHDRNKMEDAEKTYDFDEFSGEFEDIIGRKSWPIICERYIMMLYTDYIRKHHTEYSKEFIVRYGEREERGIAPRMYKIVANIAWLHGLDFQDLFTKIDRTEKGFEFDKGVMYPRFAAAMLRLGDLMDMDNNRFNIRMLKHMGLLPVESMLHLKKHKSIEHLSFSENCIEATASSDEFEVCQTANQWFGLLDQEVNDLICCWNQIVPPDLAGCRLNRCKLEIYYKGELFDASRYSQMTLDPVRVFKLLIGENIYKNHLDFIREYLQNAMDASRMGLWLWLKEYKENVDLQALVEKGKWTPFDVEPELYEQYKIEVEININWEKQELIFSIQDHGIGMESECVNGLLNVAGDSWKRRKTYASEIPEMPLWMRPTGGFGIGVQSAFMIADSVQFSTRTEQDVVGRIVRLESVHKGGRMSVYNCKNIKKGTKVEIQIKLIKFLSEILNLIKDEKNVFKEVRRLEKEISNIYDKIEVSRFLQKSLVAYISDIAGNSYFPIIIRCGNNPRETVGMDWDQFWKGKKFGSPWEKQTRIKAAGREYDVGYASIYNADGGKKPEWVLWDYTEHVMVVYRMASRVSAVGQAKNRCYHKNIWISEETMDTKDTFSLDIIYFYKNVMDVLSVNRDHFLQKERGRYQTDLLKYRCQFAGLMAENLKKIEDGILKDSLAKQILIWESLNVIQISKALHAKVLDIVKEHEIGVMRIRHDILKAYAQVRADIKKSLGNINNLNEDELDEFIFRTIVMETKTLKIEDYLKYLKEKSDILFVKQGSESTKAFTSVGLFLHNLEEAYKRTLEGKEEYTPADVVESICGILLQQDNYVSTDEYIISLLADYANNVCKNSTLEWIRITRDDWTVMDIYHFSKKTKKIKNNQTVKAFIKLQLKNRLMKGGFPVVLKSIVEDERKTKEAEIEGLWVTQVFPNAPLDPMFDESEIVYGEVRYKFLIFPITEGSWHSLQKEMSNGTLTKEKYNDIMKNKDERKLLEEWVYKYQISKPRKTMSEIELAIDKLLDWMYDLLFC